MEHRDWDENYRNGETPWDTGRPESLFVEALSASVLPEGRALEIGCGTGINARLFAEAGYDVVAVDLSPTAIETARSHPASAGIRFEVLDVLSAPLPDGPFDVVVDRGVFHVFDTHDERARYAGVVAEALRPGGRWLTLAGSTEGPPRETGPPRRTALDLIRAIEPVLELVTLRSVAFAEVESGPAAWWCLSRRREIPARPSTRRSDGP